MCLPFQSNSKRSRSRSPHSSYGITSESYNQRKRSTQTSTKAKPNGFVPDEETKKFYDKPTENDTGFWTSEDYTFRDMIAKDIRAEIEDDIASKDSDDESDEDSELADYADRADLDDDDDEEQKKTIVERLLPIKKDDVDSKKYVKPESNTK